MFEKKKVLSFLNNPFFHLILLAILSILIVIPFFHKGYFPTHDGEWAVVRLVEIFREIRDGQFPVRYSTSLNYGYGYPLFNFAYPLPYYLGLPLVLLGLEFVTSIKIIFASTVFVSAVGMYFLSKKIWRNNIAGLVSAVLYIYLPYRMVDLYARGSIGESMAFAITPLLLYSGILLLEKKKNFIFISFFSFLLAALLTSHNIMGLYFTPIILFLLIIYLFQNGQKKWKSLALSVLLGIGMASFFIIPALFEKSLIYLSQIPIADRNLYWVSLRQLIFPSWGYGIPPRENAFTYQLGIGQVGAIFLFTVFLTKKLFKKLDPKKYIFPISLFVLMLTMFFMLFPPSAFVWENLPLLNVINYPWTLLAPIGFVIALSAGFLTKQKYLKIAVLCFSVLAIVATLPYARPEKYNNFSEDHYASIDRTTTSSREYTPQWVEELPLVRPENRVEVVKGDGEIIEKIYNSNKIEFDYKVSSPSKIRINTIYYPGWKVFINGEEIMPDYKNDHGVMEINVEGKGTVMAEFTETPLRLSSDIISFLSFLTAVSIFFIGIYKWRKK